ncbi:TatD family hydrolase [Helicobacter turcicus]|uniref:TatD family hydrolase n=1 Tax=Helicobacter turcicus TaxID=2867412 RepID=A0ABS7JP46_9HELI|nr:TatD family hydrolase [Helicobacter turcicus]MBX7491167.1 TatD family hydrolase [Helicobacter turcicus]MBX7546034.1 TatD family hydrolase [Helicobacter turcicus]
MQLCDTHCHLDDARYDADFEEILERAENAGISHFIIPAADPKDLQKAQNLANTHTNVYFASGVHPNLAYAYDEAYVQSFLNNPKCIAIGECGLDYYNLEEKLEDFNLDSILELKEMQKRVFIAQIKLAIAFKKPLIVHIRDASNDSLEILQTYAKDLVGGVLHCFNADSQLLKLAPFNFYYGIGGVLTFKNARKLVEVLPKIPLESLLLETDAPYLTPHPHRGQRNEPSYIPLVLEKMQEILQLPKETLIAQINANTQRLFNIS